MSDLLRILLSPLAWLALFCAVYGLHGLLCAWEDGRTWRGAVLGLAYAVAVLVQLALLAALHSARFGAGPDFVRAVSRAGGWVGLVATGWTLFPVLATTSC